MIANSRRWPRAAAASLAAAMAVAHTVLLAGGGPAAAAPDQPGEVRPIRLVIAVDESGSLAPADVAQERIAAAGVAMSELSPRSDVTVFGFGSSSGGVPAVDGRRMCTLEPGAAVQDRDELGRCVEQNIARRAAGKGDNTDFVAALSQGIDALTRAPADDRPRVLLLLTDGKLDVRGDPNYGPDDATQQRYAEEQLRKLVVPKARAAGVQIWPIGFGARTDMAMLKYLAANGDRADCPGRQAVPAARQAADATQAVAAMMDAFVFARCLDSNRSAPQTIGADEQVDLTVTVPEIATDGAINVVKGDPRIKVTYIDPQGRTAPAVGTVGGSTYELAGTGGVVDSMRIRNPLPGRWRIHLAAPDNLAEQMVSATALWQGVLRTAFVLDPPSPRPGERFAVIMRPHTRSMEISDPAALSGLAFTAQLTGPGVRSDLRLADDGADADSRSGDAYYSAWFTLPADANGTFQVTGRATGPGVTSDQRGTAFTVGGTGPQIRAKILLTGRSGLPGAEVRGHLLTTNTAAADRRARIVLTGQARAVSVTPADVVLKPGSGQTDFTVRIGADAAAGAVGGVVQVVDAGSGAVLGNAPLDLTVLEPPSVWDLWPWALAAFVLLTAVALALLAIRAGKARRRDLKDVTLTLAEEGMVLQPVLKASSGARFEFDIVVPDDGRQPALQRVSPGARRYAVERAGDGGFRLVLPEAEAASGDPDVRLRPGAATPLPNHPRLTIAAGAIPAIPHQFENHHEAAVGARPDADDDL